MIDRDLYFAAVRQTLFGGSMDTGQVTGQSYILDVWEEFLADQDLRWLAYALATTLHETASTMMPISEYGYGAGYDYGEVDPETGQTYFGRGFVMTTWRDNYARADQELGLTGERSCEWHADNQLDPEISAATMFRGMIQGWFRSDSEGKQTLERYFNPGVDDPAGAREIINGDSGKIPSWSNGVPIEELIAGYHERFLMALLGAVTVTLPEPDLDLIAVHIDNPSNAPLAVHINGVRVY